MGRTFSGEEMLLRADCGNGEEKDEFVGRNWVRPISSEIVGKM